MAFLDTLILSEGEGTIVSTVSASLFDSWSVITDTWESVITPWATGGNIGDTFFYNNKTMFYVINGSASNIDVTIAAVQTTNFILGDGNLTKNDIVAGIDAGETAILDCRAISYRGTDGLISVSYSDNTAVSVVPIQIDRV